MEKQIHNTITIPSYGATTIPIYITYRPRLPLEIHKLFQWTNYLPSKQQMIFFWKLARMWYKRGILRSYHPDRLREVPPTKCWDPHLFLTATLLQYRLN